ncbi:MAG: hypothetical protein ACOX1P_28670 [Thermoguttaceae bacterium]
MKRFLVLSVVALGGVMLLAALTLVGIWRASQVVPDFYAEALRSAPEAQRIASETMLQKTAALASDVRKQGRWEALFTEEEINGWLAVDLRENHAESLPPGMADPRVVISPGGLQMACRSEQAGIETVLSMTLDVYLAEPNVLGIRIRGVRAGVIPLPMKDVLEKIAEIGRQMSLKIQWQQADGEPVAMIHLRPTIDEGKPVVIETVELGEREIYLAGTTSEPEDASIGQDASLSHDR